MMIICGSCGGNIEIRFEERELSKIASLVDGGDGFKCSRCGGDVSLKSKINKVIMYCNNCQMDVAILDKLGYGTAECNCCRITYMEGRQEWFLKEKEYKIIEKKKDIIDLVVGTPIEVGGGVVLVGEKLIKKVLG